MANKGKSSGNRRRLFYRVETQGMDGKTIGGYISALFYLFSLIMKVSPEEITEELLYASKGMNNKDFDALMLIMANVCDIPKPQAFLDDRSNYCLYQKDIFLNDEIYELQELDIMLRNLTDYCLVVKKFMFRDDEIIYEDPYQIVVSEETYIRHNRNKKCDDLVVMFAEPELDEHMEELDVFMDKLFKEMENKRKQKYIGADRKGMYNLLTTFDDREMNLFERSLKETVYEDYQAEPGIGDSLICFGIAKKTSGNGFKVKPECAKIYEYDIKGSEFDEDRKRTSWVNRCYRWCSYMGRSFSKEFLLKLINQNSDVQMDEREMMKRLKAFVGSEIVEYKGYIISDYWDEADEDHVDLDIEKGIETSAYVPTIQEIDEFYYRGFLFSKPSYQKLYRFLVKVLGDERKAYENTSYVWGMFQMLSNPEEVAVELDDGDFMDPDVRKKLLNLLKKAERETNIGHYYGNTIDTAIENDLDLKIKYLVPLNEESDKVRKKNKGGIEK